MWKGPAGAVELGTNAVKVDEGNDVAALRNSIRAAFNNKLKNYDADDLIVKPSQAADAKPLDAKEKLTVLKPDETGGLSVYVEVPEQSADLPPLYAPRAQQFAAMCRARSETKKVAMSEAKLPFDLDLESSSMNHILDLDIYEDKKASSPCLRASIIPGGWPLFWAKKQVDLKSPRIFYQRQSPTDRGRIDRTIEILKSLANNQTVSTIAWLGTPGIAKSSALNEVLRHFIEHLGKPDFPPVVGLRINGVVVIWEWDANTQTIRIIEKMGKAGIDESLQQVSETIHSKHGILIVEPGELDPPFYFQCPTVIALSNREAKVALKHNSKAGGVNWFIVGTWTLEECLAAAWIEEMTKPDANWRTMASTVENRFTTVGGLPRFVLSENMYNKRVKELESLEPKDLTWIESSIYNVDSNAKYFIAPEPDITSELASWKFLCRGRQDAFWRLSQKNSAEARKAITNFKLEWAFAEKFIRSALCNGETHGWEWYRDPGADPLDFTTKMPSPPAGFKKLRGESYFHGQLFKARVEHVDSTRLYTSTGDQMIMSDCLSLSRAEKTVFLYQVSSRLPSDHPFKISQCREWREALNMPPEWTLAIVYILDKSQEQHPSGMIFDNRIHISDLPPELKLEGYLVRAPVNDMDIPIDTPRADDDPTFADNDAIWITSKKFHVNPECRYRGNDGTTYAKRGTKELCSYCRSWRKRGGGKPK